jgi:hypothetical protein
MGERGDFLLWARHWDMGGCRGPSVGTETMWRLHCSNLREYGGLPEKPVERDMKGLLIGVVLLHVVFERNSLPRRQGNSKRQCGSRGCVIRGSSKSLGPRLELPFPRISK